MHGKAVKKKKKKNSCSAWEDNMSDQFHVRHNLLGNTQGRSKVFHQQEHCRQKFPEQFPLSNGFGYPETKCASTAECCLETRDDRKDPIQLKAPN